MMRFIDQFTRELRRLPPRPERLALAIAGLADPALDEALCLQQLDELARHMQQALAGVPLGRPRADRFMYVITQELGFSGNRENYYDPRNSFLNVVLHKRVGLPIMLSLICIALGDRLDLDVVGVGFPGHFMARYQDSEGAWLLDPFHGQVIECGDADRYLSRLLQRTILLAAEMHKAVSPPSLAQRILNNLRNVYLSQGDYRMAAGVLDFLLVLGPTDANLWHERGLLHYYSEQWEYAARDLKRYFYLSGQLLHAIGQEAGDMPPMAAASQDQQTFDIYRLIEETRQRIN